MEKVIKTLMLISVLVFTGCDLKQEDVGSAAEKRQAFAVKSIKEYTSFVQHKGWCWAVYDHYRQSGGIALVPMQFCLDEDNGHE